MTAAPTSIDRTPTSAARARSIPITRREPRREAPRTAKAYWTVAPERGEIREEPLGSPGPGEVLVRTLVSAVSRGTELLVHRHAVPDSVADVMRAPHQAGDLPGPVKYGYLAVGVVESGPDALVGRRVFCLHPHQDWFIVPAGDVTVLPDHVPTERAVLAGTVETAVNALWDAAPRIGDRVAVVGAGMVGLCVALLLRQHPLGRLMVVEAAAARRELIRSLDMIAVAPGDPAETADDGAGGAKSADFDLAFHTSATSGGLGAALELLGVEGELIEMSWYGTRAAEVPLGEAFHARRLTIRASQVSRISPARFARRSFADRMAIALEARAVVRFAALLTDAVPFTELPEVIAEFAAGDREGVCQLIRYE